MLQDLERKRPMEIDPLVRLVQEMGRVTAIATPNLDAVLALIRQHSKIAGLYERSVHLAQATHLLLEEERRLLYVAMTRSKDDLQSSTAFFRSRPEHQRRSSPLFFADALYCGLAAAVIRHPTESRTSNSSCNAGVVHT
jgi:hypothetical protein